MRYKQIIQNKVNDLTEAKCGEEDEEEEGGELH